jgi:hypothetical protein
MKRLIPYLLVSIFLIAACNDHLKIEKNNDPQGYADSQVVGSWKIVAVSSDVPYDWNNDGSTERDVYGTWSPCQRDNLFTFTGDTAMGAYKTGTFKINCSVTKSGVWQIVNTKDLVYTPLGLGTESERIINMTSVQFQSILLLTLNGQPATVTKTWARQ